MISYGVVMLWNHLTWHEHNSSFPTDVSPAAIFIYLQNEADM